jgi:predicted dehydrogenase
MIRIAVIGAGAWGLNHVRAFSRIKGAELAIVCDPSESARARAATIAPRARLTPRLEDVLGNKDVDAVVLATPAPFHAEQACQALGAGKHVLVEKPMAMDPASGERLLHAAEGARRILMVGHLMLHHPAVERMRMMIRGGDLGEVLYAYALRVNLGRLRRDENALWSLGPHDVSMILHLLEQEPVSVSARGGAYLQKGIEDVVFVNMRFANGVMAQIQLSWLDPRKERRLTIVGSQKMVEFDDAHPVEKLRIYDKGFDRPPAFTEYAEYLAIRSGDIHIPRLSMAEPLDLECRHFVDCIKNDRQPLSDGRSALAVIRVLDAAQRSLAADGTPVALRPPGDEPSRGST